MTTPQLTVGYADERIVLTYGDHRILLTRQGAVETAESLRGATRDTAMRFSTNDIALLDPETATVVADQIDRAVVDFDRHQQLIADVDSAGDSD